ncbi:unnamed protein product [Rotaria sordida]|uniref:Envelope protein n=1 Tax=Rotaria sordida TaxID=392033 RepID=A0A814BJ21_9BILA|nr:unnamed protein product [Rotaria sordida]CAF3799182.1 unnamed protein product [Rotaria sordida]
MTSVILIIYTFVIEQTIIVVVQKPTLKQYEHLLDQHEGLYCPCTRISIQYSEFIKMNPRFHQLCSSDFTSIQWIQYLFGDRNYSNPYLFGGVYQNSFWDRISNYDQLDFRTLAISLFYFLSQLCRFSQEVVQAALIAFQKQTFINSQAMSRSLFDIELRLIIEKFQLQIPLKMLREIQLITGLIQADALQSDYESNWVYQVNRTGTGFDVRYDVSVIPRQFSNCNCRTSSNCRQLSSMRSKNGTILFTIPGFYVGCLPSQALIQSTMECFYNQSCIDQIQSHIDYQQVPLNITPLIILESSRYSPETTIEEMLKKLFVEQWDSQTYFEQYYHQCQPTYCQYQYIEQYSVSSITKLTGLVGGLNLAFRLITPILVISFLHIKRKLFKAKNIAISRKDIVP